MSALSLIWENTDSCEEKYRFDSVLYLMSVMSKCYSIINDGGINAPVHGKQMVDGLNTIGKCYTYQLISNVQIPGSKTFDSHILMNSCTENNGVSLNR